MKAELFLTLIANRHPGLGPLIRSIISVKHVLFRAVNRKIVPLARQRLIPDEIHVKRLFLKRMGYELSLAHPRTFNEKMQWLKLNDRTSKHTLCADKYAVRAFIEKEIGERYLIPIFYHTSTLDEITRELLPDEPCIIKTTHDSGNTFIVRDKSRITENEWHHFKTKFQKSMHRNYYYWSREWQYKHIKPRIVIEKLLLDNGEIPNDYKLHCFNGKVKFVQVDMDRYTNHQRNIYDIHWNRQDFRWKFPPGRDSSKPKYLDEMIRLAEKLAKPFYFVRVDFYEVMGAVYFGEMTFHPESGLGMIEPHEWDVKLGEMIKLPVDD
jgi:hypothetical protein